MKILTLAFSAFVCAASASIASAQNAGDFFVPELTTGGLGCGSTQVRVKWAPTPVPGLNYPTMNIVKATLDNAAGKIVIINIEAETAALHVVGNRDCPLWITLPPGLTIGQGFYGSVARLSGFVTKGFTHFGIRTARSNPNRAALIASGPGVHDKDVQLKDICVGVAPTCEFILRANLMWYEPP